MLAERLESVYEVVEVDIQSETVAESLLTLQYSNPEPVSVTEEGMLITIEVWATVPNVGTPTEEGAVVSTPKATAPLLAVVYDEVTLLLLVDITLQ